MEGRSTIYGGRYLIRHERPSTIFGDAYEGAHDGLRWWGYQRLHSAEGAYWDGPIACEETKRACIEELKKKGGKDQ